MKDLLDAKLALLALVCFILIERGTKMVLFQVCRAPIETTLHAEAS